VKTFCDIVHEHGIWKLVGWFCGFKVYRCVQCGGLLEEHE